MPILLEGPAAVGKTSLVTLLCENNKLERVNNTSNTSIQDYLGSYLPSGNSFVFQEGALYKAMVNGWWFLADEFNLADPAVLNALFPLLEGRRSLKVPGTDKEVFAHPNFRFFATQNDATYSNRNQLSLALRNRFLEIQFNDFTLNELIEIISKRKDPERETTTQIEIDAKVVTEMASLYVNLQKTKFRITMREIIKWSNRHSTYSTFNRASSSFFADQSNSYTAVALSILSTRYNKQLPEIMKYFNEIWPNVSQRMMKQSVSIEQHKFNNKDGVLFKEGGIQVFIEDCKLTNSILFHDNRVPPLTFQKQLVRLAFASVNQEPVLLIGPTCYKSILVKTWAEITNQKDSVTTIHLTPDTESSELIGQIYPYTFINSFELVIKYAKGFRDRFYLLNSEIDENIDVSKMNTIINFSLNEVLMKIKNLYTDTLINSNEEANKENDDDDDLNELNQESCEEESCDIENENIDEEDDDV